MQKIEDVMLSEVTRRIDNASDLLKSALSCLSVGDYFQAQVRINELERLKFSEYEMRIAESLSKND